MKLQIKIWWELNVRIKLIQLEGIPTHHEMWVRQLKTAKIPAKNEIGSKKFTRNAVQSPQLRKTDEIIVFWWTSFFLLAQLDEGVTIKNDCTKHGDPVSEVSGWYYRPYRYHWWHSTDIKEMFEIIFQKKKNFYSLHRNWIFSLKTLFNSFFTYRLNFIHDFFFAISEVVNDGYAAFLPMWKRVTKLSHLHAAVSHIIVIVWH